MKGSPSSIRSSRLARVNFTRFGASFLFEKPLTDNHSNQYKVECEDMQQRNSKLQTQLQAQEGELLAQARQVHSLKDQVATVEREAGEVGRVFPLRLLAKAEVVDRAWPQVRARRTARYPRSRLNFWRRSKLINALRTDTKLS